MSSTQTRENWKVLNSTYTCDAPDCGETVAADKVAIVEVRSPNLSGGSAVKHLCPDDEEKFMDGTWSAGDLFLDD